MARAPPNRTVSVESIPTRGESCPVKVAINGFGRIGRGFLRSALERDANIEAVAVNDVADSDTLAALLRRDSV